MKGSVHRKPFNKTAEFSCKNFKTTRVGKISSERNPIINSGKPILKGWLKIKNAFTTLTNNKPISTTMERVKTTPEKPSIPNAINAEETKSIRPMALLTKDKYEK
jgi:hypothetical protein